MRYVIVVFYLGIAGWQIATHYDRIFPSDRAEREALRHCYMMSHQFDVLDPASRSACLKGQIGTSTPPQIASRQYDAGD